MEFLVVGVGGEHAEEEDVPCEDNDEGEDVHVNVRELNNDLNTSESMMKYSEGSVFSQNLNT